MVSVPFRGSCSEILPKRATDGSAGYDVSVPFRGSCSEIKICFSA